MQKVEGSSRFDANPLSLGSTQATSRRTALESRRTAFLLSRIGSSTTNAVLLANRWFCQPAALPGYRVKRRRGMPVSRA